MAWIIAALSVAFIIVGDKFIKDAALASGYLSKEAVLGMVLYAISAPCWVYVMQHKSLPQVAVMYAVLTIIGVTLLGTFYGEYPTKWQIGAIIAALAAAIMSEM